MEGLLFIFGVFKNFLRDMIDAYICAWHILCRVYLYSFPQFCTIRIFRNFQCSYNIPHHIFRADAICWYSYFL